jgi:hypothetical protein
MEHVYDIMRIADEYAIACKNGDPNEIERTRVKLRQYVSRVIFLHYQVDDLK